MGGRLGGTLQRNVTRHGYADGNQSQAADRHSDAGRLYDKRLVEARHSEK